MDQAAQSCSIAITSAFQQFVVLTNQWLNNSPKNNEFVKVFDELREDAKHLGGYLQLLFQVRDLASDPYKYQYCKYCINQFIHITSLNLVSAILTM